MKGWFYLVGPLAIAFLALPAAEAKERKGHNYDDQDEHTTKVIVNPRNGGTSTLVPTGGGGGVLIDHRTGEASTVTPGGVVNHPQGGPPGQLTPGGTVEWPTNR